MKRVLIANRGEIALRVIRTCQEMDLETVAVYSEADRYAKHALLSDYAYPIGPPAPKESYLCIEKIIEVAKKSNSDAIHPGYGFLSENPDFAQAVMDAGLIFIGPHPKSMQAMSSKTKARQVMEASGVPVIPGLKEPIEHAHEALLVAQKIGFPVMIKAAFGGGGKGMRLVENEKDFVHAFESAKREAQNAFGNGAIYIEKYLRKPRHIEVQIFGDQHGQVIAFPERECSVQRRHQKLIEESPSPFVDAIMREKLCQMAIQAAKAVDYVGAGTIECLADADHNFYFMEMNTRLQVEHPVTESVTHMDLVRLQIEVALGKKLQLPKLVPFSGHAMEARICAEDPNQNFMPAPGLIHSLSLPSGPFVRVDDALYEGYEVPKAYDSMIAKVIAFGEDRLQCIQRLQRALGELSIEGCGYNRDFIRQILSYSEFVKGQYDTGLIERLLKEENTPKNQMLEDIGLIALALKAQKDHLKPLASDSKKTFSAWKWQGEV